MVGDRNSSAATPASSCRRCNLSAPRCVPPHCRHGHRRQSPPLTSAKPVTSGCAAVAGSWAKGLPVPSRNVGPVTPIPSPKSCVHPRLAPRLIHWRTFRSGGRVGSANPDGAKLHRAKRNLYLGHEHTHPIDTASDCPGSQAALAATFGVTKAAVHQWLEGRRVPLEHCVAIEQATNGAVTRRDLVAGRLAAHLA